MQLPYVGLKIIEGVYRPHIKECLDKKIILSTFVFDRVY